MPRVVVIGAIAILLFDAIGAFASRTFGFNYAILSVGSFLIQAAIGFFCARHAGLILGALAGGIVAFTESTLGWYLSWVIGPGRPTREVSTASISMTIVLVTTAGIVLALLGAALGRLFKSERRRGVRY